jgi:hypothetical protein
MSRLLPGLTFATIILAAGMFHGLRTERWAAADDADEGVPRLDALPAHLGDWHGEPESLDAYDVQQGGIKGYRSYRYRNAVTGDRVSLLLVCGRAGPISVHTPDVCYGGAGFEAVGGEFRKEVPCRDGRVLTVATMQFKSPPTLTPSQIEVNWAWNGGRGWVVPQNPRLELARYRTLYKLYVVRDLPLKTAAPARDASIVFMQTFLPALEQLLAN